MAAASNLMGKFVEYIINPAILVIFAGGFFLFTWGLVQFMMHLEDGSGREDGKRHMIWGLVGMLVMVSVYGIISLLDSTFGLDVGNADMNRLQNITGPVNFF